MGCGDLLRAELEVGIGLHEMDAKRRNGFLPLLERTEQSRGQVFMTATAANWPQEMGRELQRWCVKEGTLLKV